MEVARMFLAENAEDRLTPSQTVLYRAGAGVISQQPVIKTSVSSVGILGRL